MTKELAPSLREYSRPALLTIAFALLEVVAEVTIPFLMGSLIDKGIQGEDLGYVLRLGGLLALLALFALVFGVSAGKFSAQASAGFAKNLRSDEFRAIQRFSFGNIDRFSEGSLITRLTTDVTNVQQAFMMLIRVAVRAPATLVFALVMSFVVNPSIGVIFLVIIPFLGAALWYIASRAHPVFERVFRTYDRLNTTVQENIRGIRAVKAFAREPEENQRFQASSRSIFRDFTKAERILAFNQPSMQLAVYVSILVIAWVGAHQIISNTMTTGELVSVFSYAMQILTSLMMLAMVFVMVTISRTSAERIGAVLAEQPTLTEVESPVQEVPDGSIEFCNVSFSYGRKGGPAVLSEVSLSIGAGQTIGVLGATGSGKSSLVQLIPRLYDVTVGQVLVGGRDVREYGLDELRDNVSIVLQKNVLFEGTVAENLRWGDPDASVEGLHAALEHAGAAEFIDALPAGLDASVEQGGSNFSGGQRQRLCLARALLKKPKILILDDATSAVDTATEKLIRRSLSTDLMGTTKIIVAQRITSVQEADLIVIIHNGRLVASGTHAELLATDEEYKDLYRTQNVGVLSE